MARAKLVDEPKVELILSKAEAKELYDFLDEYIRFPSQEGSPSDLFNALDDLDIHGK